MADYVHVGDIIEQERLRRQVQIAKGVNPDVVDHIEKAVQNDSFQSDMESNLSRFADDISGFDKAETEFLLSKLQRQLNADSGSVLLKSMQTIALQHMNDIEKADEGRAVGETKQMNGKTYVWTEYAPGKFDWHISEKRGKQEQPQGNKQAKTPEAPNSPQGNKPADVSSHAKGASTDALKRAAADENAAPEVRQAAKQELENRGGESDEKEQQRIRDFEDDGYAIGEQIKQQAAQSKKNAEKAAKARKEKKGFSKKEFVDKIDSEIQSGNISEVSDDDLYKYIDYSNHLRSEGDYRDSYYDVADELNKRGLGLGGKKYSDFGYSNKSQFDKDIRSLHDIASGKSYPMTPHSRIVKVFSELCSENSSTKELYEFVKKKGLISKKDVSVIDKELSKIGEHMGAELVSGALEVMGFDSNHSFSGKEKFGKQIISWINKYADKNGKSPKEMFDYLSDNMETLVDAPNLDEDEIQDLVEMDGWDDLNDIMNEMCESFEVPPEEEEVFNDNFLSILRSDMGNLGNSRKEKASQKKLVSIAYDFQKKNPDTKLTDEDWQQIVGGDVDETNSRFGKMKGFKKLNQALEKFYDGIDI